MSSASFYAPAPETPRDDLLRDYFRFLEARNGDLHSLEGLARREAWLTSADGWTARHRGVVDPKAFERHYRRFDGTLDPSPEVLALLAFVKVNAGEALGVEILSKIRYRRPVSSDLFDQVERVLAREEQYHTRILAGATRQFDVPPPSSGWRPTLMHRVLFATLAYAPGAVFHPILLGAEIGGVFILDWLLARVGEIFRNEAAVRETLERRLIEILIDEVGHIAFNRMAVGRIGRGVARRLSGLVAQGTTGATPEFLALGWTNQTLAALERFDYRSLPAEVKISAFFV